jgi:hypothetical protein
LSVAPRSNFVPTDFFLRCACDVRCEGPLIPSERP